ncbi:MAG: hypothetical protein IKX14_05585 [Neisseriaceae bacterium]|nr:hypothetical protein [Neisseriaceae bacterium]
MEKKIAQQLAELTKQLNDLKSAELQEFITDLGKLMNYSLARYYWRRDWEKGDTQPPPLPIRFG